jgi:DNA-binding PadR family transcriptional regulator
MAEKGLNATAAALLGLLHEGPMTGGQLMATAEGRLGPFWTTTRSQVYRELPVLADRGYVRLGKPGPRSSQPYALTATGKRAFARWLGEDAGRDQLRNPLLLRAAFGGLHKPAQLDALYTERREEHNTRLAELREELKEAKKTDDPFRTATLEFAITYQRAILRWLDSAPRPKE